MALEIIHRFQSEKPDGTDESEVRPSNWNENHVIEVTGPCLIGKGDLGNGEATEISLSDDFKIVGDELQLNPDLGLLTKDQADDDYAAAADLASLGQAHNALAQSTAQALAEKMPADAEFASVAQGQKADVAVTYDADQKRYKKPDGSIANLDGGNAGISRGTTLVISDSRDRWAVTDTTNSDTAGANYSYFEWLKFFSEGRIKRHAFTGNQGFDIKETLDVFDTAPPCNAATSFDGSGTIVWGGKGVDLSEVDKVILVMGINHWTQFDFTSATFELREVTNSVVRANIEAWAIQLLNKVSSVRSIEWLAEMPVGKASTNFNGGNTIKGGYVSYLNWFNKTLLPSLCAKFPNLKIRDYSQLVADKISALYQAQRYGTLSTDGTQDAQDMHPTGWIYRIVAEAWWNDLKPELGGLPMGIPMSASDKMGVDGTSFNVYPDSLLVGATVPAKVIYGGGTGTTVAVDDAYIDGPMYPEMAVQINQVLPALVPGNFSIVTKKIPCPSGLGNAIQADLTANIAFDGSLGFRSYISGIAINAAITSGFLTLDEYKVIQSCAYFVAGLAGAKDGEVIDFDSLRQMANQFRVRMSVNNYFTTAQTYGLANNNTDFSGVSGTTAIIPGRVKGVQTKPPMLLNGITPGTPKNMLTQTMLAPNTNEYDYYYVSGKMQAGQTARLIIGNVGLYIKSRRADGLLTDII